MELGFDNWRATIGTLTEEELDLVRHDRGRKCADWTECHGYDPIKLPQKVFRKLRYVDLRCSLPQGHESKGHPATSDPHQKVQRGHQGL